MSSELGIDQMGKDLGTAAAGLGLLAAVRRLFSRNGNGNGHRPAESDEIRTKLDEIIESVRQGRIEAANHRKATDQLREEFAQHREDDNQRFIELFKRAGGGGGM